MPTSLLSKWDMFSPENPRCFCESDLEVFLCCVALSRKKRKPIQPHEALKSLNLLFVSKTIKAFITGELFSFTVSLKPEWVNTLSSPKVHTEIKISQKFSMPDTKLTQFILKLGLSYLQQRPRLLKAFSSL